MKDTIIINGKELDWLEIGEGFKIPSFNQSVTTAEVPGRNGSVFNSSKIGELDITIPLIIKNEWLTQDKDYDTIVNELVRFLDYGENPVQLRIKSKQWYWNAYFEGPIEILNKTEQFMLIEIKFRLCDPYKYALVGNKNTAISDSVSVVNLGTAPTPIIVEARALKDSTNFMITKGDKDYFMIGKSEDANKTTKDVAPFLFNDEFNSNGIGTWRYMPNDTSFGTEMDGGDAMGGRFKNMRGKESIYPSEWGSNTKTGWHGAAIYKTLTKSIQDFRIRFKISVHPSFGIGPGKAVAFLVDENNRTLFSVAFVNTSSTINNSQLIVYAYNEHGNHEVFYVRHVPSEVKKMRNPHVFMFFERVGKNIKFTNYFYDSFKDPKRKKPIAKDERIVIDRGNLYQRKVRILRLYVGKSAKFTKSLYTSLLGFSVQELLPNQNNVTPIKIRSGDNLVINTAEKIVTINDESALHLKDFASNYFNVDPGKSELIIYPPNTFDTTVKWQDRFL